MKAISSSTTSSTYKIRTSNTNDSRNNAIASPLLRQDGLIVHRMQQADRAEAENDKEFKNL
ncbi:hypothetical protein ACFFSY_06355 [Paenibacillus aurantiacus]|uniref:Uncharacterized protein n=1 Tax=Paenibacillus aurantiacus TaxID=1936118 RepID=A0ABV5KJY9_9BACL